MKNINKSKKKRIIIWSVVSIIIISAIIAVFFIGNYLVSYALGRAGDGGNRTNTLDVGLMSENKLKINNAKEEQNKTNAKFLSLVSQEEVSIKARDGIKLSGSLFLNKDSNKWVIAIHGYRSSKKNMVVFANKYYEKGFNILTPDLRGSGKSEGNYIGMGWLDKNDILEWVKFIENKDKNAKIVITGVSMGGATTMMVAGEKTPDSVKLFVEDCGYTSVWDIFSQELKLRFKLPTFPILDVASFISNKKVGYNFKEASALEQIKKSKKPIMFIHATEDDFVPFKMLDQLYNAKVEGDKEKLVVKGAGHVESHLLLGDEYWDRVFSFVEKHINR